MDNHVGEVVALGERRAQPDLLEPLEGEIGNEAKKDVQVAHQKRRKAGKIQARAVVKPKSNEGGVGIGHKKGGEPEPGRSDVETKRGAERGRSKDKARTPKWRKLFQEFMAKKSIQGIEMNLRAGHRAKRCD